MSGAFARISLFALLSLPAFSQNVAGTITGIVQDASGGVISKASVIVTNEDTNVAFRTVTTDSGEYTAPNLAPGTYSVTTEIAGFRPAKMTGARLLANRTLRLDFTLETGTVTQSVEVQAAAPVINSESATI